MLKLINIRSNNVTKKVESYMSSLPNKRFYTLDEYFALVRQSDERYEYWDGEIFCMSGNKKEHVFIEEDVFITLSQLLKGRNCQAFSSAIAIKVPAAPPFRYADGSVICGEVEFEEVGGVDTLVNPILLIEILSPSTERYDRTGKFSIYKSIPSFQEYLLIAVSKPCITQFVKQKDGAWQPNEVIGLESNLYLPSIDRTLSLNDVYQRVKFKSE